MTDTLTSETPVVELTTVSKRFGNVLALDRVSLQILPGEVHALVGENGAGKSTLIKVITGVYQPDGGEVHYKGRPVSFDRPLDAQAAGISTTYQELNLVPQLSVAENLFIGRERTRFRLVDVARMRREAREVLERYGIDIDVRRQLREFGLGVQQMVAIVRAVSTNATVVVMDEPTSSLEPREIDRLAGVVDLLREHGVAVLYVTHKLDEVFRLCQRVTVLRDGCLVGTTEVASTTRLGLVSMMLGRDAADVGEHGVTLFGAGHGGDGHADAPVLQALGLARRHVLDNVSVDIHAGEVVGLAGLLGSGRTETAKAIFGVDSVDAGELHFAGRTWRRWTPAMTIRAGLGMVAEDRKAEGIVGGLSVRDNIVLAALPQLTRAGLVSDARCDTIVETFMRRLRIRANSPHQRVSELSGGNQQKVLLARMLCLQPAVLILDEPTRGIDVGAKAEIQALVDALAEDGLGVLLISSELEEVVEGADRVLVLKDGAVIGTLQDTDVSEDHIMAMIASTTDG
jgi:ribose transport system ATP-binding protein